MSDQEKKDKKFSIIMTSVVHGLIILLLVFLVAWRAPDPPIEEYGIELNFGFQEQGGGDIERDTEAQLEETEEDTPPDAEVETEQTETETEETDPVEEVVEEVAKPEPEVKKEVVPAKVETQETVKDPPTEEVIEDPITTKEESEVKVEEVTPVKKEEIKEEPPVEEKKEEVKPKPKPKPVVDQRALMGGKKKDSDSKEAASNNQGKYPDKKGNQGDPEGNKKTDGINPDGSDIGSVSYSLDGWKWERPPAEKDDSQIDGVIKFGIDVDDRGKVLTVSVLPGTTISDNTIVEFYKKQVLKLSFIQTDGSKAPAPISKGEVTFVIKTN
ncbi:hypothetical protein BFP97_04490 [Roseivirga sp. 4D4]|uniref:hypothetical protein n=1 Tax=Roseivirga sp. 4D4 TaxID=1889784 RepID=UPI0008538454|nr:hypothetical protein [Roseivirga sp. 4D4]OEK00811.1 hypothetical protein BFP97_04490 [Roseivirga sp. 4D4]